MFQFDSKTKIIACDNLSFSALEILNKENAKRVGLLIDRNVFELRRIQELIKKISKEKELFVETIESREPTTDLVDGTTKKFKNSHLDFLIGIGGGSTLDLAKAVSVMLLHSGRTSDYHGTGKELHANIPKMMIPTTAGTGSEVTPGAVLVNPSTSFKRALGGAVVGPEYALLDPHLTLSMPEPVLISTAMDALGHAIESYTAKCANLVTQMYSKEAFSLIFNTLPQILDNKNDIELRRRLQVGSTLAGFAIYNSNTGACHSLSYPLGIYHEVPHGLSIARLLPKVVSLNIRKGCTLYADLFDLILDKKSNHQMSQKERAQEFGQLLENYSPLKCLTQNLKDYNISNNEIPFLSKKGLELTSALENNPVKFTLEDARFVLEELI